MGLPQRSGNPPLVQPHTAAPPHAAPQRRGLRLRLRLRLRISTLALTSTCRLLAFFHYLTLIQIGVVALEGQQRFMRARLYHCALIEYDDVIESQ